MELYVQLPVKTDTIDEHYTIALLNNIDALIECSTTDINENYLRKHSFGLELLSTVDNLLKTHFPHIRSVKLYDASYMPCNRTYGDTLDLLSYSIALYGKTWYERKINAYIEDKLIYENYKTQVGHFISTDMKNSITFESMAARIIKDGTMLAKEELHKNYNKWQTYFTISPTLPVFFKQVLSDINNKDKCMFCKGWLVSFVGSYVTLHREWVFDIPVNYVQTGNKRRTRKYRTKK